MSKSTETTNDRVPRVLVRFGKHPSSVGNTHRVWETPIKRIETPIKRIETPIECGKRPSSVGKHTSSVGKPPSSVGRTGALPKGTGALPKGSLGVPKRAGLSEREDAGRGGVPLDESLGGVGVK